MKKSGNLTIVAGADCTGHGVPGAFMSMLGMSFLGEIVSKGNFDSAGDILNRLRKKIKNALKQQGKGIEQKDGMDIALCIIDNENMQLQYAGAYNSLYIVRSNELYQKTEELHKFKKLQSIISTLIEIKADRQPIGIYMKERPFSTTKLQLYENDLLYMFSDGFVDQPGGEEGKKYLSKNFKHTLLDIHHKPMDAQHTTLNQIIDKWKGDFMQVDDILILGIKI